MKNIFINGKFLCQTITGVQRHAVEIVKKLDLLSNDDVRFTIVAPSAEHLVSHLVLNNISIVYTKGKPNYYWEQIVLPRYCKKHKPDDLLNLCNIAPIMYPGSCTIHDLGYMDAPKGFSWKQRIVYRIITRLNIKRYKHVFTVSCTIKKRIGEVFRIKDVAVVYNGYEHMIGVKESKPDIELPETYYFSLGSMNSNKNFKAIIRLANSNPSKTFLISGKRFKSFSKEKLVVPDNVIFTGYLYDPEIKYLYRHCKAFLFPSIYEGFGVPPLEAYYSGCQAILCNNIPVLKELYGECCSLSNFENVDLDNIEPVKKFPDTYSWNYGAKVYFEVIKGSK